ncbi:hypothetical protein OA067_02980 [Gammaproteobacteria bacterium]|nr:hypothetical protein [Gammaproteobacteria bacterium]
MNILGLHFGHDAAACVLIDGEIKSYVIKERISRVKHAATMDRRCIELALNEAKITPDQLDYCAIASTQNTEPVIDDATFFNISEQPIPGRELDSVYYELLSAVSEEQRDRVRRDTGQLLQILYNSSSADKFQYEVWSRVFPEHRGKSVESINRFFWFDAYVEMPHWVEGLSLDQIGNFKVNSKVQENGLDRSFHCPVTVRINGLSIPGAYIHHHFAHAAASFFSSPFEHALIMTHDGFGNGRGYSSGMFYLGSKNKIFPISPHHLHIGAFYDRVGAHLGLGPVGGAGKLMGLSSYGKPRFYDSDFLGNQKDFDEKKINFNSWIKHCEDRAKLMGYDLSNYQNPDYALDPINVDLAASSQKLFEEIRAKTIEKIYRFLASNEITTQNLCLSGGTALNCPSNSHILNEGPFANVYVEPCCDDSGIALGAALSLHHNVLGKQRSALNSLNLPFVGLRYSEEQLEECLHEHEDIIEYKRVSDPGKMAANDLAEDHVLGWFEGKSEIGPRALGARSILADPRKKINWNRVNKIKRREYWRPFAPAVLESEVQKWFGEGAAFSPFMLFNYKVLSNEIPAVTHIDNTARVQTVNKSNGNFFNLVSEFKELTGIPIVLNTSFNGPGEPIVESPSDALSFFLESDLDLLYLEHFQIRKKNL